MTLTGYVAALRAGEVEAEGALVEPGEAGYLATGAAKLTPQDDIDDLTADAISRGVFPPKTPWEEAKTKLLRALAA